MDLANRSLPCLGVCRTAAPFLRRLMQRTGLTVHLGVLSQNEVVLIDRVAPGFGQQMATWVGKRMPIHCTGLGKALMAFLPSEQIEFRIKQGLIRYNDNTIVSARKLKEELLKTKLRGFALDDEEETVGLRCIGVPLFDQTDQAVAAISVVGTLAQLADDRLDTPVREAKRNPPRRFRSSYVHDAKVVRAKLRDMHWPKATRFRSSIHTSTFSIRSVRKAFHGPAQRTPCSIGQRFPAGMRNLPRR